MRRAILQYQAGRMHGRVGEGGSRGPVGKAPLAKAEASCRQGGPGLPALIGPGLPDRIGPGLLVLIGRCMPCLIGPGLPASIGRGVSDLIGPGLPGSLQQMHCKCLVSRSGVKAEWPAWI
eukprot:366279-Chlamydomonas_euryale.AAC.17